MKWIAERINAHIDWLSVLSFFLRPLITIAIWFVVDRLLVKLHKRSTLIERLLARHAHTKPGRHSIEQRIKTFKGISLQTARALNALFFIFILLGHFNIDPKPLLAGIGVVGLGLSLAAQNILRDFINGLFIVIEDQFNVGDWVTIGAFSGTVENFTMRATRLRATDGRLITIPNGSIGQVVNSTKDYAVAYVEIGVSYGSNIPQVLDILNRCGKIVYDKRSDVMLGIPNAQGILSFRDNDILLRVMAKTLPGEQWGIEREIRMTIKEEFDKQGVEIPFPQRVVHSIVEHIGPIADAVD